MERVDYPKTLSLKQKRPATLRLVTALLGLGLVDVEGRLIGINTAILTRTGGNQGIGFAVPVNLSDAKLFANRSALFANDAESAMIACSLL